MTTYVPIIDVSHHQGVVDFATMKRRGVRGVIIRISNGDTLDTRAHEYYPAALAAGFDPADLLWYVFVNPKRCSAARSVEASIEYIRSITGHDDAAIMWDFEHFDREAGTRGPGLIRGAEYANYARSLIAGVERLAPGWRQFAYSNAAFWDHWVGSHGDDIVELLDWIVPRYPVYPPSWMIRAYGEGNRAPLNEWIANSPKPPDVDGWADWAFEMQPKGPVTPRRTDWAGWQFSADYNRQGPAYGTQSSDLDLNVVDAEAWARWTATTPTRPPDHTDPEDPDMAAKYFRTPASPTAVWVTTDGLNAHKVTADAAKARRAAGQTIDPVEISADEAARYDYFDSIEHGTVGLS